MNVKKRLQMSRRLLPLLLACSRIEKLLQGTQVERRR
jgi:hypothetical protein